MPKNRLDELQTLQKPQKDNKRNEPTTKKSSKKDKNRDTKLDIDDIGSLENQFEIFEILRQWTSELEANTRKCQETYRKAKNSKGISKKLKDIFKESETIAHRTAESLRYIRIDLSNASNKTSAEYRMKLVQFTGLVERFKIVASEHEKWAQEICEDEKRFIQKCHQIVNQDELNDSELNRLIEENPHIFTQDYIQNELEARRQLADIEARHEQLITIEKHLVEIKDLFVNLGTLVELQQESLNRVEFFATQATEHIDVAVDELKSARKSKKRGRKIKIIIVIVVVVILVIVLASIFG